MLTRTHTRNPPQLAHIQFIIRIKFIRFPLVLFHSLSLPPPSVQYKALTSSYLCNLLWLLVVILPVGKSILETPFTPPPDTRFAIRKRVRTHPKIYITPTPYPHTTHIKSQIQNSRLFAPNPSPQILSLAYLFKDNNKPVIGL